MPSLIVRGLDDELVRRLKERAARQGRSAEAEHRAILEQALRPKRSGCDLWRRLSRGARADLDRGVDLDRSIRPAEFE